MPVTALVIDDSAVARRLISHHLQKIGCVIAGEAANADAALKLFHQLRPDLVTLDVMMPRILHADSMALLRAMKREKPELKIIIISTIAFRKTRDDFLEQGVLDYVVKPITDSSFDIVRTKLRQAFAELASRIIERKTNDDCG